MDAVSDPSLATARGDLLLDGFLPIEGDPMPAASRWRKRLRAICRRLPMLWP